MFNIEKKKSKTKLRTFKFYGDLGTPQKTTHALKKQLKPSYNN